MRQPRPPIAALATLLLAVAVRAEDIEPRRWTPLPVGTTVVGANVLHTDGEISVDPVLKVEDGKVEATTSVVSLVHGFDLLGRSARIDVLLPHQDIRWRGTLDGVPRSTGRTGPGDPLVRFSVSLLGGPALDPEGMRAYLAKRPVHTVVGAGIAVVLPLGEYLDDKLLNIGSNRFVIRPQLGVVHSRGPWSFELTGSVFLFTENDRYLGDRSRAQDPLLGAQGHIIRSFGRNWWVSASAAYDQGGETSIDGVSKRDPRADLLYGLSIGVSVNRALSLKLGYVGSRSLEETGVDTQNVMLGCSIRF